MVWCGDLNGRSVISGLSFGSASATEYIFVTSIASGCVSGGRTDGSALASSVFPDPGGPLISRLWLPAAATSSARFPFSWPRMPEMSNAVAASFGASTLSSYSTGAMSASPRRYWISPDRLSTG